MATPVAVRRAAADDVSLRSTTPEPIPGRSDPRDCAVAVRDNAKRIFAHLSWDAMFDHGIGQHINRADAIDFAPHVIARTHKPSLSHKRPRGFCF
jgi:hypothetical protein